VGTESIEKRSEEMRDFFEIMFGAVILLAVTCAGLFGVVCLVDYTTCKGFANTGYETRWQFGCYAKVDGTWMPKEYVYGSAQEIRIKDKQSYSGEKK
jgi:hypothetical protein